MKYRKNGRTYRLVMTGGCELCPFDASFDKLNCPEIDDDYPCIESGGMWRETLFSKIRNWRRKG